MTDTTNVPVPLAQTTPPAQLTALERYGRSGGDVYGDLLRFSGKSGGWVSGAQAVEIPIGTQLVAIIPEMLAGYVKWSNGELVEQALVPVTETYDPKALRASLGDTDPSRWPQGENGVEDPWKEAAYLPMKDLDRRQVQVLDLVGRRHARSEAPRRNLRLADAGSARNYR